MAIVAMNFPGRIRLLILFSAFFSALSFGWRAAADIYVYRDPRGVLRFTNVPNQRGFRRVVRSRSRFSPLSSSMPQRYQRIVRSAARRYGVDESLVWAIMKVESDFNSRAVSRKGAKGLMQLMPKTARLHKVRNVYDPIQNIRGGVRHLRLLLDRFKGDTRLALAAYNAGAKAVERYKSVPPFPETREYVRRVLSYHKLYRQNGVVVFKK